MRFGEPPTSGNTSVHNGRKTTSGQVLRAGRPMFLVRYALDEPDNALRVMNLRVARTVFPKNYTSHAPMLCPIERHSLLLRGQHRPVKCVFTFALLPYTVHLRSRKQPVSADAGGDVGHRILERGVPRHEACGCCQGLMARSPGRAGRKCGILCGLRSVAPERVGGQYRCGASSAAEWVVMNRWNRTWRAWQLPANHVRAGGAGSAKVRADASAYPIYMARPESLMAVEKACCAATMSAAVSACRGRTASRWASQQALRVLSFACSRAAL